MTIIHTLLGDFPGVYRGLFGGHNMDISVSYYSIQKRSYAAGFVGRNVLTVSASVYMYV